MTWFTLLLFAPIEFLLLIILGGSMLVMLGVIRPRQLAMFVGAYVLLPMVAEPVIDLVFAVLPLWALLVIAAAIVVSLIRFCAAIVLGNSAADQMIGSLAASLVVGVIRLFFWPLRAVWGYAWSRR